MKVIYGVPTMLEETVNSSIQIIKTSPVAEITPTFFPDMPSDIPSDISSDVQLDLPLDLQSDLQQVQDQQAQDQVQTQQAAREAILDLLLLGMHADRHISLLESDLLDTEMATLGWDEFHSPEIYLQRAAPIVRDAIGNGEKQAHLLQSIADRLSDGETKKDAIERFAMMLAIDGTVEVEEALLDQAMLTLLGSPSI
jgi:hypothetical protein